MHESIAKAQVKGSVRKAVNSQLEFEKHSLRELERGVDISGRKKIERFVQGALDTYTSLEIGRWSKRRSSSWHSQHLQMYFNPDSIPVEGVGELYPIFISVFDTRKINKGHKDGHRVLFSSVSVHEHFMTRLTQRVSSEERQSLIHSIEVVVFGLHYTLTKDFEQGIKDQSVYQFIVSTGQIIIATFHKSQMMFVLNTVLMSECFTVAQAALYQPIFDEMKATDTRYCIRSQETHECTVIDELNCSDKDFDKIYELATTLFGDDEA